MRKIRLLVTSLLCVFALSGCISLTEEIPMTTYIEDVIEIENLSSYWGNDVLYGEKAWKFLEKENVDFSLSNEFTLCVVKDIKCYKAVVATEENETFVYRNTQYDIPQEDGDDWIAFGLPGSCKTFKIFTYQQRKE